MRTDLIPLFGSWLLTYLLHSTLLLGIVWLVTRRLVATAAVRDLLWKAALLGGFATATLQQGLGFEPLGGALALQLGDATPQRLGGSTAGEGAPGWGGLLPATAEPVTVPTEAAPTAKAHEPPGTPIVRRAVEPPNRRADWIVRTALGGWAALALAFCGLYLVQRARALRRIGPRRQVSDAAMLDMLDALRRAGNVRRIIRLTAAEGLASPVALGHDEIALPDAALTDLDPDQQRCMLAHELAHLERRDPTWLALACLVERAFFLQPLNRLARIRIQEAAEYLCDDWAVHRTGSGLSLAACLVKVAEWVDTPRAVPLVGMAERRSQLVSRIHRLLEGHIVPATPRSLWLLAGAVTLVGLTAVAAPGITAASPELQGVDTTGVAHAAPVAEPDSGAPWYGRLAHDMGVARDRARVEARRALREARTAMASVPKPPRPPSPPLPPLPPVAASVARMDAVWSRIAGPQRDTNSIAVPALIEALRDGDVEVRRAAARSLGNLEDPRSIPALIDALRDSDAGIRACVAGTLGQFEDKRAVPGLVALLKDSNRDVRHSALSSLENFRDQVPTAAILSALGDEDPEIKVAALNLARGCDCEEQKPQDPRIVQAVIGLIPNPNAEVREGAINALQSFGLKEAPAPLLAAAKDKDPDVREQVAEALGSIGDPRAVPALRELLTDGNADVREQAVNALSEIRDRSALEALVGALKSPDPAVRRSAADALGQREEE